MWRYPVTGRHKLRMRACFFAYFFIYVFNVVLANLKVGSRVYLRFNFWYISISLTNFLIWRRQTIGKLVVIRAIHLLFGYNCFYRYHILFIGNPHFCYYIMNQCMLSYRGDHSYNWVADQGPRICDFLYVFFSMFFVQKDHAT